MIKPTSIITLTVMGLVVLAGAVYILFFIDESEVQKRNNTPAAQALIIDEGAESFTDREGNAINVNDNFGNVMVVTSWASWCPQCIEGVQALGGVAEKYRDKDVVVLAVNRGEDKYTAERYLSTVTLPDSVQIILDPSDHYFGASEGYAMPETIVYDEDGQEKVHQRGNVNVEEIERALDELLK